MSANNNIRIIGRLGRTPEMKYAPSGTAVTRVSVAVDNHRNGSESAPDWFSCVAFGKTAEALGSYGEKGRLVAIEGSMHQNRWEKDGQPRISWELNVNSMQFLDRPPATEEPPLEEPDFA